MKKISVSDAWVERKSFSGGQKASPEKLVRFNNRMSERAGRALNTAAQPGVSNKTYQTAARHSVQAATAPMHASSGAFDTAVNSAAKKMPRPMGTGTKAAIGLGGAAALGLGAYGIHKMRQNQPTTPAQPTPPTQPIQKMGSVVMLGFIDELEKISGAARQVLQKGTRMVEKGWQESGGWAHGRGRISRYLPGGKALTAIGAAASLPGAISKEDASGKGRSRTERIGGVIGGTIGGLAGSAGKGWKGMAGGTAGGFGGEYLGGQIARRIPGAGRQIPRQAPVQQAAPQAPQVQQPVPSAL